jgi:hypothetical protein
MPNTKHAEPPRKPSRREHRFIVRSQERWSAILFHCLPQFLKQSQRRLVRKRLQSYSRPAPMIDDGQGEVWCSVLIRLRQQIAAPDPIAWDGSWYVMLHLPSGFVDQILVTPTGVGDIGLLTVICFRAFRCRLKRCAIVRQPASGISALSRIISSRTHLRIRKGDRLLFRLGLPWTATGAQRGLQPEPGCNAVLPLGGPKRLLTIYTGAEGSEVVVEQGVVDPLGHLR